MSEQEVKKHTAALVAYFAARAEAENGLGRPAELRERHVRIICHELLKAAKVDDMGGCPLCCQ